MIRCTIVEYSVGVGSQVPPVAQAAARPFGLPARLRVAALARRRARVLGARSDRYLYTLYTVGLFYALPVLQFVAAFQIVSTLPLYPSTFLMSTILDTLSFRCCRL